MRLAPLEESLDAELYGGKAAQLAVAVGAGLPVPPGVALSRSRVQAIAAGAPAAIAELERTWPLLHAPLAVRSSAVGEDSEGASFAGQHLTRLNVRSLAGVTEAVRAVRRSAHSESALAYRRRLGLAGSPRIAVVVQELVDADCAGVLFTRSPLDGADELVVEAAWGLGEAVVAGLVTPDRFRVAKDGTVLERVAGAKDLAIRLALDGGTEEVAISGERVRALCLDDSQLAALAQLAERCGGVFSGALDLEWALRGDELHLLQCRAVTRAASLAS
ncbi:MAG: PEP/pyruvate-binding domain-containing protein [Actinomycetota bacterium]